MENNKRPIVFFDLETTGVSVTNDRIVEIYMKKINQNRQEVFHFIINPCIPIPKGASDVHGITDDMVVGKNRFSDISNLVMDFIRGCDLAGYNIVSFDLPLLIEELGRDNIKFDISDVKIIDVFKIERLLNSNKLTEVYKRRFGSNLSGAHSADNDVNATINVFTHQMLHDKGKEITIGGEVVNLSNDIELLHKISVGDNYDLSGFIFINDKGHYAFAKGKHKNKTLQDIWHSDRGYFGWIHSADFSADTKNKLKSITSKFN